jgi:hypothetical protein
VKSRWRRGLANAGLVVASVLLCLLALEAAARVYRRVRPPLAGNRYTFRLRQPPPYRGAWYFCKEFVDETFRQPNGWFVRPGTRIVVPGDFRGKYINVVGGQRRTTDAPAGASHRVFVIGGSAIYAAEVPDSETVPSQLQRLLNARQPGYWRVENYGYITVNTGQQLELLRTLPVAAGDLVIFEDGVNDVVEGIYNGNPRGWMAGENRKALAGVSFLKGLLVEFNAKYVATRLQDYSALVTILGNIVNRRNLEPRPQLLDAGQVAALSRETAEVFRGNLAEAARFTAARGARFVHFLQPQIYGGQPRTAYEQSVVENFYVNPNGLEIAFTAGYPALREAMAHLSEAISLDLSATLDARTGGEEFYLDFCHLNHIANGRIAAAMLRTLP